MKKTYPDICLERANKSQLGSVAITTFSKDFTQVTMDKVTYERKRDALETIPELARRLNRAIKLLRRVAISMTGEYGHLAYRLEELADELEAPPEEKK